MMCSVIRCPGIAVAVVLMAAVGARADEPDDVVASVGEDNILREDVASMARRLGLSDDADATQRQRALAVVLEQLIDERALRSELIRAGMGVEPEAVTPVIDRLRKEAVAQGRDFDAFLAESGRTLESLREHIALEMAMQAYLRPRITADALNRLFSQNQRELDGTRLRVSHVLFRPDGSGNEEAVEKLRKRADGIRSEIVQGRVSFAEAAAVHSVGPSRRDGGDLGWITREGPMLEPFTSVVFKLAKGGVSEPFLTPYGVHIVTITAVEPGRIGLTAVRSQLEKMLASEIARGLVLEGRRRSGVTFAPGVPHFDPSTLGETADRRPVVAAEPPE